MFFFFFYALGEIKWRPYKFYSSNSLVVSHTQDLQQCREGRTFIDVFLPIIHVANVLPDGVKF